MGETMSSSLERLRSPGSVSLRPLSQNEPDPRRAHLRPVVAGPIDPAPVMPRQRTRDDNVRVVLNRLLNTLVETLDRRRPVSQLHGKIPPDAYELTQEWVREAARHNRRYRLGRGRFCPLTERIVEASTPIFEHTCATYQARAVALRLELHSGRWHCTVLRVL